MSNQAIEKQRDVMPFQNRWFITGTITTRSELHIGDGGAGAIEDRSRPAKKQPEVTKEKEESDASTVCVDGNGRAYIPGSGLKGAVRDLASDANGTLRSGFEKLLGFQKPGDPNSGEGGKLEFWDAFLASNPATYPSYDPNNKLSDDDRSRPWWDDTRRTCVAVSVSLDRRTKTAKENLLYHLEYVPAGETFRFEITGDNIAEVEMRGFLDLLAAVKQLGAETSNGWGRVEVKIESVRYLDAVGREEWKKNPVAFDPSNPPGYLKTLAHSAAAPSRSGEVLEITLNLHMESPWLVRDARHRERSEAGKGLPEGQKPSDAVPIHDKDGKACVPSKSLRGALRARAEMILRTLDFQIEGHPGDIKPKSTKGKRDVVAEVKAMTDLAAKLFGCGDWKACITVPRLAATSKPEEKPQEFVGIDRFTGGAADGAKFNAVLAGMTILSGTLRVDLARLRKVDPGLASLGLLALVLRDLAEGDIPIGSGSAKGQGYCTAEAMIQHAGQTFDTVDAWFSSQPLADAVTAFRSAPRLTPQGTAPATSDTNPA